MSSFVLLNHEGVVERKLQLISLPSDYVVPEGMMVSWMIQLRTSYSDPLATMFKPKEQVEAWFYLGKAQGQVRRSGFKKSELDDERRLCFGARDLTVTVQGTSAKDINDLRDRIMHLIQSGERWNVSNDLNPKPEKVGFWKKLKKMFGVAK